MSSDTRAIAKLEKIRREIDAAIAILKGEPIRYILTPAGRARIVEGQKSRRQRERQERNAEAVQPAEIEAGPEVQEAAR